MVVTLAITAICLTRCRYADPDSVYFDPKSIATHPNGTQFVGSETCMECHPKIYEDHRGTAHHRTSAASDSAHMAGSFEPGSNVLDLEGVRFRMLHEADSFYLETTLKNRTTPIPPASFDVTIGSGLRGQSYLTWEDDRLYQLQPSYYTPSNQWINSPGYPDYYLKRPIRDGCLKCHMGFAGSGKNKVTERQYDQTTIMYGISCERCHGPMKEHVVFQREHPGGEKLRFVTLFDTLTRQERLDVCAQCHSGPRARQLSGNAFSFLPGDALEAHSQNVNTQTALGEENLDVHGNQYGLLAASACFRQSPMMDCTTCHNPHTPQRGAYDYFNAKCMECHQDGGMRTLAEKHAPGTYSQNCIACHMPISPSRSMTAQLANDSLETPFYIRTHRIAIYQDSIINL